MSSKLTSQIEKLQEKMNIKRQEIEEIREQMYKLIIEEMTIQFGSVLSRTSNHPLFSEYDEYLIVHGGNKKIVFVNTNYWMPELEFDSMKEAKDFIEQDEDYKWKIKMLSAEFTYKEEK